MAPGPVTVLDVGNSAAKLVAFGPRGAVRRARRLPLAGLAAALRGDRGLRDARIPVVAVCVRAAALPLLRRGLGRPLLLVGRDLPVPLRDRSRRPGRPGADRLCAALAAAARARGPAAAIGCGTALTADAVDRRGTFLGGAIAPGLRAAAAGLRAAAPALPGPDVSPGAPAPYPGRTTAAALRAGFLRGFAGMADRLGAEAAAAAGPGAPVFLHGGDAAVLAPHLRRPFRRAPHLVAEGARLAWIAAGAPPGPSRGKTPGRRPARR